MTYHDDLRRWSENGMGRDASEVSRTARAAVQASRAAGGDLNAQRLAAAVAVGARPDAVKWDDEAQTVIPVGGGPGHKLLRIYSTWVVKVPNES